LLRRKTCGLICMQFSYTHLAFFLSKCFRENVCLYGNTWSKDIVYFVE